MQQPDRRRAMLSGSGSKWDFEFYADGGVLPPAEKMSVVIINPSVSSTSYATFVNGFYRLIGICNDTVGGGGIGLRLNSSYLGLKCEIECAFYIRKFSVSEKSLQFNTRASNGIDFIACPEKNYFGIYIDHGSGPKKLNCSGTTELNVRYVLRCEVDGENGILRAYMNDELRVYQSSQIVIDSNDYAAQVMAVSAGYYSEAIVDIEYYKYRRL